MKVEGKWRKRGRVGDSTLRTVTQKEIERETGNKSERKGRKVRGGQRDILGQRRRRLERERKKKRQDKKE